MIERRLKVADARAEARRAAPRVLRGQVEAGGAPPVEVLDLVMVPPRQPAFGIERLEDR
jgi:hypothetical protein